MTYFPAENMCLSSLSWESNIEEDSQTNGAFLSGKCKVSMIGLTAKKKKKCILVSNLLRWYFRKTTL